MKKLRKLKDKNDIKNKSGFKKVIIMIKKIF